MSRQMVTCLALLPKPTPILSPIYPMFSSIHPLPTLSVGRLEGEVERRIHCSSSDVVGTLLVGLILHSCGNFGEDLIYVRYTYISFA